MKGVLRLIVRRILVGAEVQRERVFKSDQVFLFILLIAEDTEEKITVVAKPTDQFLTVLCLFSSANSAI
tara:strand:+ start:14379 stop:14585 length:207 start_codon:yes stop_codon:yes gene_type:complete